MRPQVSEAEALLAIWWLPTPRTIHISVSRGNAPELVIGTRGSVTRLATRLAHKGPHDPPLLRYRTRVNDRCSS